MEARLDHVVLWVEDPLRSVAFYEEVVGLPGVRVQEFRERRVPFPSVRISDHSILDLMPRSMAPAVAAIPGAEGSAGNRINHVCLAMRREDFDALRERLAAHGVDVPVTMRDSFGAQGLAPEAIYFGDPDGNVLEARWYG